MAVKKMGFDGFPDDDPLFPGLTGGKPTLKKSSEPVKMRCYERHPPYEVSPGLVIYGGSCGWPIVPNADVYGGFDHSMRKAASPYPWEPVATNPPIEFLYSITDMQAPKDPVSFKCMVEWLASQLHEGKKVHIGCVGGHGRTGLVLAALRMHMEDDVNAVAHVREHYCKKAVESSVQMDFLHKHFGIKPETPAKSYSSHSGSSTSKLSFTDYNSNSSLGSLTGGGKKPSFHSDQKRTAHSTGIPMNKEASIWAD